ncbi:hypothetical protein K490DRAFT_60732 [Saccharata proteae CBS 121410]|uniref:Uncharacterized protein n=1 Tax=Saccharata proteae CBS 121410 TaxID=1314787 RepID=A0A9P4LVL9_9PEZI|nr:hypothetical protein K490DRAFT_60732 [Saccharata proteae CBS 121410]
MSSIHNRRNHRYIPTERLPYNSVNDYNTSHLHPALHRAHPPSPLPFESISPDAYLAHVPGHQAHVPAPAHLYRVDTKRSSKRSHHHLHTQPSAKPKTTALAKTLHPTYTLFPKIYPQKPIPHRCIRTPTPHLHTLPPHPHHRSAEAVRPHHNPPPCLSHASQFPGPKIRPARLKITPSLTPSFSSLFLPDGHAVAALPRRVEVLLDGWMIRVQR